MKTLPAGFRPAATPSSREGEALATIHRSSRFVPLNRSGDSAERRKLSVTTIGGALPSRRYGSRAQSANMSSANFLRAAKRGERELVCRAKLRPRLAQRRESPCACDAERRSKARLEQA